ncbi:MAG: TlpA family protein disulfide reductase [Ruminiclostridium sp.]|nr:TlpA family protein disulfide reductase [Ruminiclostridium sp.]
MNANKAGNRSEHPKVNKFWTLVILLSLIIFLGVIGVRLFKGGEEMLEIGDAPGNFALTTFSNEKIHTGDLQGKIVLVNFWASWCVTCDEEAVLLEKAWQELQKAAPGETLFLGVAYMDTEPAARSFLQEYGVTYPNGPDLRGEISDLYQVQGVPETFVLDQDGVLRNIKYGPFLSVDEILSLIQPLLTVKEGE